jgi:regulator of replication initiation timing
MNIFLTQQKAKEEIRVRDEKIADLEDQLRKQTEESSEQHSGLSDQVVELTKENERLSKENKDLSEELGESKAELEAGVSLVNDAKEKLESFDDEVEKAAAAKFESLGGQPAPAAGLGEEASADEIRAKFEKMKPGEERSAYFREHQNILSINS